MPFETLTVLHTGAFGVCDFITDLGRPFPNLAQANIMDVWNSPRFRALRRAVNSSSPPPMCLSCEIKTGHLSEEEKRQYRSHASAEPGPRPSQDERSVSMGSRYVDLHWLRNSDGDRREAALRERAEQAEARVETLTNLLAARDQEIDAMKRSRTWRLATRWRTVKRVARRMIGPGA